MNWLSNNADWIFSGFGIAIPIALIGWIISKRSKTTVQKQSVRDNSTAYQANGNIHIGENNGKDNSNSKSG